MCPRCNRGCESQPRIRCTPTFFHHPIFGEVEPVCCKNVQAGSSQHRNLNKQASRGGPAFQTTALETRKPENQCCKGQEQAEWNDQQFRDTRNQKNFRTTSTAKQPVLQKQISFNPQNGTKFENAGSHNPLSTHTLLWYNPEKEIQLQQANCYHHGLPKQRKLIEMSSCPFYPTNSASIQNVRCRGCSKLTNCPLCGGYLSCSRCRLQSGIGAGCNCQTANINSAEVCTCGPCKRCGCGDNKQQIGKVQQSQCKCQRGQCNCGDQCACCSSCPCCPKFNQRYRLNSCKNCADFCPCDKNCICSDNCACCEVKAQKGKQKSKACPGCQCICSCGPGCDCGPNCACCSNSESRCDCGKGRCNCSNNCSCGSICKCCPKFLPYGTCYCKDGCRCGSACQCSGKCECCPKNKKVVCPKQSYNKTKSGEEKFCSCGPQCGCGPECRCGPSCRCEDMKKKYYEEGGNQFVRNKQTKQVAPNSGTRKVKMEQKNVKKSSQPVFKSLAAKRR